MDIRWNRYIALSAVVALVAMLGMATSVAAASNNSKPVTKITGLNANQFQQLRATVQAAKHKGDGGCGS